MELKRRLDRNECGLDTDSLFLAFPSDSLLFEVGVETVVVDVDQVFGF